MNELISDNQTETYKESIYTKIDGFICKSFRAARKANPYMRLFYNDYSHLSMRGGTKTKSDKVFDMIKTYKNCGIDGVGFQSHVMYNFSMDQVLGLKENIQRYAEIGVDVEITELDVKCTKNLD